VAARIITAQPAWQLPITQGLAVTARMQRDDLLQENRFRARNVFDGLTRHRLGQEADKIAGMPSLQRNSDFAVRLEAADARAMAGARVYHDKWPAQRIDLHTTRRADAHQRIVVGPLERAAP